MSLAMTLSLINSIVSTSCCNKHNSPPATSLYAFVFLVVDLSQKGMQTSQQFGAASSYGKKYSLGNLFLIDDTADADTTNSHGKSNAVNKIKEAAKPSITAEQLQKAREYIAAGGSIDAIESKYKLTNEQKTNLTKTL